MTPTLTDADRANIAAAWIGVGSAPNLARDLQAAAERTYRAGLAAGMERAGKDAERYRWLNEPGRRYTLWLGRNDKDNATGFTTWPVFADDDLSAAIDAAIRKQAKGGA